MDQYKYNAIAHSELAYASPINDIMVDEIADLMQVEAGTRVIDIGCAKAEILLRMAARCQVQAVGTETSESFLQAAHEAIASRHPAADITLRNQAPALVQPDDYDTVMCVNSSELFGSYDDALQAIIPLTDPGGTVLMGDYYWLSTPTEEIATALQNPPGRIHDYNNSIAVGEAQGLTPIYVAASTQADLDRYEWRQIHAVELYARQNPDDPDTPMMLQRIRQRRSAYIQYGRDHLGFGLFLFKKEQ